MGKVKWYIYRASRMNILEVLYRIKVLLFYRIIFKRIVKKIDCRVYSINYLPLKFSYLFQKDKILDEANKILGNEYRIFDKKYVLNSKEKFITDPIQNKKWHKIDVNKKIINYSNDPKLIWELNKQQYLVTLGVAYLLTRENIYAEKILDDLNEWIDVNEEINTINWSSNLEISLRIISWIFSISLIKEYIINNKINIKKILKYINIQAEVIYNKLSLYSSANNHLIGELTGLLYSSYFLNLGKEHKWYIKATNMLNSQISYQFWEDGVNKEQSINYQIHTMDMYFLGIYLLELNNEKFNKNVYKIIENACLYIRDLSLNDGKIFNIGDEDGGSILKIINDKNNVLSTLNFGAYMLNKVEIIAQKNYYYDVKLAMLYGDNYNEYYKKLLNSSNVIIDGLKLYKHGGMYIRRGHLNDKKYIASFDFGSIGMKPLYAHAHSDILSFNLSVNNNLFITDMGTYKYDTEDNWRNYFRGVKAHNTISINDIDQFNFWGPFMCSKSPISHLEKISSDYVECSTYAYKKYNCFVKRSLKFNDCDIIIKDTITNASKGANKVTIFFNFDYKVKVIQVEKNSYKLLVNGDELFLKVDSSLKTSLYYGYIDNGARYGWQSCKFKQKIETFHLVCEKSIYSGQYSFIHKIYLL